MLITLHWIYNVSLYIKIDWPSRSNELHLTTKARPPRRTWRRPSKAACFYCCCRASSIYCNKSWVKKRALSESKKHTSIKPFFGKTDGWRPNCEFDQVIFLRETQINSFIFIKSLLLTLVIDWFENIFFKMTLCKEIRSSRHCDDVLPWCSTIRLQKLRQNEVRSMESRRNSRLPRKFPFSNQRLEWRVS